MCTRSEIGKGSFKEPSFPLESDARADELDLATATWHDGHEHTVPGLTHRRLRLLKSRVAAVGELWSGTVASTQHKVTLQQRVDRALLLSMYEQSRQVLQIRLDKFVTIENQHVQVQPSDPILKAALAIMIPIAEKFVAGTLQKCDLKQARDEAMKAHVRGSVSPAKGAQPPQDGAPNTKLATSKGGKAMKKPAATSAKSDTEPEVLAEPPAPVLKRPTAATLPAQPAVPPSAASASSSSNFVRSSLPPPPSFFVEETWLVD